MKQKKIMAYLHSRIKLLADAAVALGPRPCYERGEITQCDRQHDGGYILTLLDLKVRGFFLHRDSDEFPLRKHHRRYALRLQVL